MKSHIKKHRHLRNKKKFLNLTEFLFADDRDDDEGVGYIPIEIDLLEIEKMHNIYV